jgi:hypothetical protein
MLPAVMKAKQPLADKGYDADWFRVGLAKHRIAIVSITCLGRLKEHWNIDGASTTVGPTPPCRQSA